MGEEKFRNLKGFYIKLTFLYNQLCVRHHAINKWFTFGIREVLTSDAIGTGSKWVDSHNPQWVDSYHSSVHLETLDLLSCYHVNCMLFITYAHPIGIWISEALLFPTPSPIIFSCDSLGNSHTYFLLSVLCILHGNLPNRLIWAFPPPQQGSV